MVFSKLRFDLAAVAALLTLASKQHLFLNAVQVSGASGSELMRFRDTITCAFS